MDGFSVGLRHLNAVEALDEFAAGIANLHLEKFLDGAWLAASFLSAPSLPWLIGHDLSTINEDDIVRLSRRRFGCPALQSLLTDACENNAAPTRAADTMEKIADELPRLLDISQFPFGDPEYDKRYLRARAKNDIVARKRAFGLLEASISFRRRWMVNVNLVSRLLQWEAIVRREHRGPVSPPEGWLDTTLLGELRELYLENFGLNQTHASHVVNYCMTWLRSPSTEKSVGIARFSAVLPGEFLEEGPRSANALMHPSDKPDASAGFVGLNGRVVVDRSIERPAFPHTVLPNLPQTAILFELDTTFLKPLRDTLDHFKPCHELSRWPIFAGAYFDDNLTELTPQSDVSTESTTPAVNRLVRHVQHRELRNTGQERSGAVITGNSAGLSWLSAVWSLARSEAVNPRVLPAAGVELSDYSATLLSVGGLDSKVKAAQRSETIRRVLVAVDQPPANDCTVSVIAVATLDEANAYLFARPVRASTRKGIAGALAIVLCWDAFKHLSFAASPAPVSESLQRQGSATQSDLSFASFFMLGAELMTLLICSVVLAGFWIILRRHRREAELLPWLLWKANVFKGFKLNSANYVLVVASTFVAALFWIPIPGSIPGLPWGLLDNPIFVVLDVFPQVAPSFVPLFARIVHTIVQQFGFTTLAFGTVLALVLATDRHPTGPRTGDRVKQVVRLLSMISLVAIAGAVLGILFVLRNGIWAYYASFAITTWPETVPLALLRDRPLAALLPSTTAFLTVVLVFAPLAIWLLLRRFLGVELRKVTTRDRPSYLQDINEALLRENQVANGGVLRSPLRFVLSLLMRIACYTCRILHLP